MMKTILTAITLSAMAYAHSQDQDSQDADNFRITPIQVTIANKTVGHLKEGTCLALCVTAPPNVMFVVPKIPVTLTGTDSTGKELEPFSIPLPNWADNQSSHGSRTILLSGELDKTPQRAICLFSSPSFPSEGARQIRLRGTLPLNIVEKQETTPPQPIDIKDGATIEQEGVTLQINKVETESRSTSFRYTVSYSNDSLLAGVVFLDQNGDKADSLFMGQGTLTSDGKHIEFQYHSWNKKYKTLKAAFIFNRNIKHINIPVDVTFGTSETASK